MHIVFLSGEYPLWTTGGIGTFLQLFGRALIEYDHYVTILGIGDKYQLEILEDRGVNLIRLPKNRGKLPNFIYNSIHLNKKLKELNQEHPIDIIESAELGFAFISKEHVAKKIIRLHGGHHFFAEAENRGINWRKGWLEKQSFKKADGFIAVSNYVKEHTSKFLSYHKRPIEIISSPVDTSLTLPEEIVNKNILLFAGTICEKKGVRQLIEAFKIVRELYPEKILDFYGRDWFYPDGSSYIEMLKENYDKSFFENINFHGAISREELDQKYSKSAICVFPSHMETQGLVSMEAMLLKKPVIFTKYGPGPETISHKETGLLCDVYDPEDIAAKIIWCIENIEKANILGENARKVVIVKYNIDRILEMNINFYKKIIE